MTASNVYRECVCVFDSHFGRLMGSAQVGRDRDRGSDIAGNLFIHYLLFSVGSVFALRALFIVEIRADFRYCCCAHARQLMGNCEGN